MQPVFQGMKYIDGSLIAPVCWNPDTDSKGLSTTVAPIGMNIPYLFNETAFDRLRGNTTIAALASAARTASTNSAALVNYNARGVHVVVNTTVASGTGGLTVALQAKDPVSGNWYILVQTAAIIAVSTVTLKLYPGLTPAANAVANDILPRNFRIFVTAGDGSSYTYSVGVSLIV